MLALSKTKAVLKRSELAVRCVDGASSAFNAFLYSLSPVLLARFRYLAIRGKKLNLEDPQTFEEKLLWLMLYWRHPLKTRCADKYGVRSYAEELGLAHTLSGLLGVYSAPEEIDFPSLPDRCVLKCTHGSHFNIFCEHKHDLDVEEATRKLHKWMKTDISKVCGEVHYTGIQPRIICELFLDDLSGDALPRDYKLYCFGGQVHCTMVCSERGKDGHAEFDFYDRAWKNKLPYSKSSVLANRKVVREPDGYEEMLAAAERLSKPFPFVRVDFYSIKGKAVLGEMTFTPNGCIDAGYTDLAQRVMGELIHLPPERML